MNTPSLFRLLLLIGFTAFSHEVIAQPFASSGKVMMPLKQKNQWGVKVDLPYSESYAGDIGQIIPGVTYTIGQRHQLFAGIMFGKMAKDSYTKLKSPLLGSNLMYQFYPFRQHKVFNAFAYYSNDLGKYTTNASVTFVTINPADSTYQLDPAELEQKNFVMTNVLGVGFDLRAGKHFYGNILAGSGVIFRQYQSTITRNATGERYTNPKHNFTDLALEVRLGIGWRF
jgi:hypothetical protein